MVNAYLIFRQGITYNAKTPKEVGGQPSPTCHIPPHQIFDRTFHHHTLTLLTPELRASRIRHSMHNTIPQISRKSSAIPTSFFYNAPTCHHQGQI